MISRGLLDDLRQHVVAKKTGIYEVSAPARNGTIALAGGAIVHATTGKAEGEKAFFRLLATADAKGTFAPSEAASARTITSPTPELLASSAVALDEVAELYARFSTDAPLVSVDPGPPTVSLSRARPTEELSVAARSLLHFLRSPIRVEDLLDTDPGSDHEILTALVELDKAGRVRALPSPKQKVSLASAGDFARIEKALEAPNPRFFGSRPRLVIAGAPHRLAVVAYCVSCLEGATAEPAPSVPMPHVSVRFVRERIALDIVVCPLVPAYSPLWPMALAGAHAALRLDGAARELFDRACAEAQVKIVDAGTVLPSHDDTKVEDVAALVRAALTS